MIYRGLTSKITLPLGAAGSYPAPNTFTVLKGEPGPVRRGGTQFTAEEEAMLGRIAGPLQHQEGGDHYRKLAIQPIEYIHANGIGFAEGSAIKYLTRWRDKGGVEDLKKARHFIDLLIELEGKAPAGKASA